MIRSAVGIGALACAVPLCAAAMAPGGQAPAPLKALRGVETGQWELRERGSQSAPRRICIGDPIQLMQPNHPDELCHRYVVTDTGNRAVITYQCPDAGTGRTDLRVETPRLVQINAQGVDDSTPFSVSYEGRKTGECR